MDQARDAVPKGGDHDERHDAGKSPVATIVPATVSGRLRAAREALGLTTADIAARTRITMRHVNALDQGDLASLPGRPYVLGFVRSYARVVGLDEADLAALARSELDAGAPKPAPRQVHQFDVDDPAKTPSRLVTWLALGLFLAVLAVGGVFWRSYYSPAADLPSLAAPDPTPSAVPAQAAIPANPAPGTSGPVVFTAREGAIWVKFYDGHGQQLLQKQLAMGESYTVPADAFEPRLWTGRPDALTITVGGQAVPPLSDHRGIVRDVPVTAQALLARAQPAAAGLAATPVTPVTPAPTTRADAPASTPRAPHRRSHHADTGNSADPAAVVAAPSPTASAGAPPVPAATASGAH
jgi:transcriptional regulator with XRE-family HTH domain